MPVAENNRVASKSALRHRPIIPEYEELSIPAWTISTPRASRNVQTKREIPIASSSKSLVRRETSVASNSKSPTKSEILVTSNSKVPAKREIPVASNSKAPAKKKPFPSARRHQTLHWAVPVVLTIMSMLVLTLVLQLAWNWGTSTYNNLRYGMPRTMQVDAFVGHETGKIPSHFIAENMHGRVVIMEMPGGDVQHVRVIVGPQIIGPNADQEPVILSFVDRNGKHIPDMLVQFGSLEVWYANENGTFVPQ
jgi:hypothetical protein